jgi:hypothetical protein
MAVGNWICGMCGFRYGKTYRNHIATYHQDKCDYCGRVAAVTEPRDYGYPELPEDAEYEEIKEEK